MKKLLRAFWAKYGGKASLLAAVVVLGGGGWDYYTLPAADTATVFYYVVSKVDRGTVTSGGIVAGAIIAAQKLDRNVYKQATRIEAVNIVDGGQVTAGDTLLSFDKSSARVDVEAAQVEVAEARLDLATKRENRADPNTTLRTLKNDIATLETAITQAELEKTQAYRDYLNANLTAESGNQATKDKIAPTIGGLYTATTEGEYRLRVYQSGARSGYSYDVSGLTGNNQSLIFDLPTELGADGLTVTITESNNVKHNDEWVVAVPNVYAPEYVANHETYEDTIATLETDIANHRLEIANKQQQIDDLKLTDAAPYRDVTINRAEAALSEARVQLAQNNDAVRELDIVAPFSGTIEGMKNVVVGATPTGSESDPISLGTLISNEFLVTFPLDAVAVSRVKVGQKVLVNVTSFPELPPLTAHVTDVSSLPADTGVGQYEVQALIAYDQKDGDLTLREGLLADVEVVEQEVADAVRVPRSALVFKNTKPVVYVLGELTPEQQTTFDSKGHIKVVGDAIPGYPVDVTIGAVGKFYAEIQAGLLPDTQIIISQTQTDEGGASLVTQQELGDDD